MNYVLSFSGGRTSAYMTEMCLRDPQYKDAVIVFCNTGKEHEKTLEFVNRCDLYWRRKYGARVIWLEYNPDPEVWFNVVDFHSACRNGEPFRALILKRKFTPNRVARFCTQELKIRVMKKFCQKALGWKHWTNLVGIRYDEPRRWSKKESVTRNEVFEVEHPLVKMLVTKPMVLSFWKKMPFDLEIPEYLGNCDMCFLKGIKKKQRIIRTEPERAKWWSEVEKLVEGRFHKDYSFDQMVDFIERQPQLFNVDDSIECACTD